jgi:HAD superfamily hydrolase (TIGR01509 family)
MDSRIDAVIFDMDGVLVDSEPLGLEAMRRVMARHGVLYTESDNEQFLGVTTGESCRVLKARHRLAAAERDLARQYLEHLLALIRERPRPMPGVPDVLARLRAAGYRLALASSAEPEVIAANVASIDLAPFFEAMVSGGEVVRGKPAPDVFVETARRLGLAPAACLVVEDSRNGLLAAKAAGMSCAVVPCAATRHQDFSEADHRLRALADLLSLLV